MANVRQRTGKMVVPEPQTIPSGTEPPPLPHGQTADRRGSIELFVQTNPEEAQAVTKQHSVVGDRLVASDENVPKGCLSKDMSDILTPIMLGEKELINPPSFIRVAR